MERKDTSNRPQCKQPTMMKSVGNTSAPPVHQEENSRNRFECYEHLLRNHVYAGFLAYERLSPFLFSRNALLPFM